MMLPVPLLSRLPVEEEDHRADGEQRRAGERQVGEAAGDVAADRQGEQADDRHQLEGDAVRQADAERRATTRRREPAAATGGRARGPRRSAPSSDADGRPAHREAQAAAAATSARQQRRPALEAGVEDDDQQRRDDHVELVGGEAGVPVGRPAREAARRAAGGRGGRPGPTRGRPCRRRPAWCRRSAGRAELGEDEDRGADEDDDVDDERGLRPAVERDDGRASGARALVERRGRASTVGRRARRRPRRRDRASRAVGPRSGGRVGRERARGGRSRRRLAVDGPPARSQRLHDAS